MCTLLKEIHEMSAENILKKYGQEDVFPVDIVSIAQKMGISLGSIDFSELEKYPEFKNIVAEKGHILGLARVVDNRISIVYHNALYDSEKNKYLSDVDKKEKLFCGQRFTIAHEIAHCILHMNPDSPNPHIEYRTDQLCVDASSPEGAANIYAGALLIPCDVLQKLAVIFRDRIFVDVFADFFKVSTRVMSARISHLKAKGELKNAIIIE